MLLIDLVWASIGGFLGAMMRHEVDQAITKKVNTDFTLGIFTVDAIGCLIAGMLIPLGNDKIMKFVTPFVGVGFCGALTTFSSYAMDDVKLFEDRKKAGMGVAVFVATVAACFTCVTVGYFFGLKVILVLCQKCKKLRESSFKEMEKSSEIPKGEQEVEAI